MLLSLGLAPSVPVPKSASKNKISKPKSSVLKRSVPDATFTLDHAHEAEEDELDIRPTLKKRKSLAMSIASASTADSPLRRSGRTRSSSRLSYSEAGSAVSTPKKGVVVNRGRGWIEVDEEGDGEWEESEKKRSYGDSPQRKAQKLGVRTQDP